MNSRGRASGVTPAAIEKAVSACVTTVSALSDAPSPCSRRKMPEPRPHSEKVGSAKSRARSPLPAPSSASSWRHTRPRYQAMPERKVSAVARRISPGSMP